jgi:glycosyltransferase involved in cell wall biosynthesis
MLRAGGFAWREASRTALDVTIQAVKVRGPYHGPSGYDHHVRAFVRGLAHAGVRVQLEAMPEWSPRRLPESMRDPWYDTLKADTGAHVYLQFCLPQQLKRTPGMTSVNFTMFEASRIPLSWVRAAQMSLITIVPEESSRRAWIDSGVPEAAVRTCPLGIDPELFAGEAPPLDLQDASGEPVIRRQTRLLNISEIIPRKNQQGLFRAWLRATHRADDAVLIVKLGGYFQQDREGIEATLARLEQETGKRFSEAAPLVLLYDTLSDDDMVRLYGTATHYISMSFGEGWDLPMMEAAASGLRLIAPDHTAYRTYLNPSIATLLPVRKATPPRSGGPWQLFVNSEWWEPDLDAAVEAIRAAIEDRDQAVASPRDYILGQWTWDHATARLIEILTEAEALSGPG